MTCGVTLDLVVAGMLGVNVASHLVAVPSVVVDKLVSVVVVAPACGGRSLCVPGTHGCEGQPAHRTTVPAACQSSARTRSALVGRTGCACDSTRSQAEVRACTVAWT